MRAHAPHDAQHWQLWLDGPSDLVSVWQAPPSTAGYAQWQMQRDHLPHYPQFHGAASEEEARKVVLGGYAAGAAMAADLAREIQDKLPPPKSRRRTRKWGEEGDEASLERVQLGLDNPWVTSVRALRSACGLVEVIAPWGLACNATLPQLAAQGAAALALTDLLERADFSVELALVGAMRGEARRREHEAVAMCRVDLKRMGEPVDLEALAAVAVYPAAWRVYGLAAFQLSPWEHGRGPTSHPHTTPFAFEPNGMWGHRPNVMTILLGRNVSQGIHTQEQACSAVKLALEDLESLVNPVPLAQEL